MEYLSYDEYISLGGVCDLTAFNRNIDRACSVIDRYTQSRVSRMAEVPKRVKTLCRDLIEFYATNSSVNEKEISSRSESAGVVSESVSYVTKSQDDMQNEISELIEDHLWELTDDNGTPLLYKGCMF